MKNLSVLLVLCCWSFLYGIQLQAQSPPAPYVTFPLQFTNGAFSDSVKVSIGFTQDYSSAEDTALGEIDISNITWSGDFEVRVSMSFDPDEYHFKHAYIYGSPSSTPWIDTLYRKSISLDVISNTKEVIIQWDRSTFERNTYANRHWDWSVIYLDFYGYATNSSNPPEPYNNPYYEVFLADTNQVSIKLNTATMPHHYTRITSNSTIDTVYKIFVMFTNKSMYTLDTLLGTPVEFVEVDVSTVADIYPTISSQRISIDFKRDVDYFDVFTIDGRLVNRIREPFKEGDLYELNVQFMQSGMYMIVFHVDGYKKAFRKIIKK